MDKVHCIWINDFDYFLCYLYENILQNLITIFFFSFLYPELAQLTGVAAILRFPMPELEDSDDDDDEDGAAGGNDSDSD